VNIAALFEKDDLIPVVVQHYATKAVLMLGFANQEAVRLTLESRTAWFWSRSRGRLWQKGESSKNYLHVIEAYTDCDSDALLLLCRPDGPTCHTGDESCFFTKVL
jgi:phosphoribosyl-AMP cyclohydrolase